MSQLIHSYIAQIQAKFDTGQSTEHSFRKALESLLEELNPSISALNESQRITWVGMPDFTIKDRDNPTINIWRIEAKDLYVDLSENKNKDQLGRYLKAFDNFVYTNNLTFNFYRNGKMVDSVSLGTATRSAITRHSSDLFADNISKLEHLLQDFLAHQWQTITSSEKLARAMAQKAQLIKYAIQTIFANEETESNLTHQYTTFKDYLVHDLTTDQFADMYAQTIAYGLFTARLHDPTLQTFSRAEAERLIPKSTPFIRRLFKQMSSDDTFDDRVAHIVDDLVAIFLHCNVEELLTSYNAETGRDDPIIHFYETFLWEYDAAMRKKRGVYYTPEPVVKFIVRGVDHLLQTEFGLSQWLADTSKIEHTFTEQGKKIKKSVHRVQVLDPATGTGTFLDETIKYIHQTYFANQSGIWSWYVSNDLLPRIWWFEILMASYTMAHLKLGITLWDTWWTGDDERFNIYLTNSLEEPHGQLGSLFATQLAKESEHASKVKNEQPVMVVMGNPPYRENSINKSKFILDLIDPYKENLKNESNIKPLSNDYVKFIRYAEQFIEKNNEWILAYISSSTYLDWIVHRTMRQHLLKTFDKIYILNLHWNSDKKETTPDWWKDENVFDIKTWVAIIFWIKNKWTKKWFYYYDVFWIRDYKYHFLINNKFEDINREKINVKSPKFNFSIPLKSSNRDKLSSINNIFNVSWNWPLTKNDGFVVWLNSDELKNKLITFFDPTNSVENICNLLWIKEKNNDRWDAKKARKENNYNDIANNIVSYHYRAFDFRKLIYNDQFVARTSKKVTNHYSKENVWLIIQRQTYWRKFYHVFCTSIISDRNIISNLWGWTLCPLYLYPDEDTLMSDGQRTANLDMDILWPVLEKLWAEWVEDGSGKDPQTPSEGATRIDASTYATSSPLGGEMPKAEGSRIWPEDIFDYIYAVLHSPSYRETYKEFLKIDFPRIPFTDKLDMFWQLVAYGRELRWYHLMETIEMSDISELGLWYMGDGDNTVTRVGNKSRVLNEWWETGRIYIHDEQYFDHIPLVAWEFYIGGYQPAQKRLKDRKGKTLSYDDIIHYQKIIVALTHTARVMTEIDKVKFL